MPNKVFSEEERRAPSTRLIIPLPQPIADVVGSNLNEGTSNIRP
jgi:hypothetical protein